MDIDQEKRLLEVKNNLKSLREFAERRREYQLEELKKKKESDPSFKLVKYLTNKD
jgi:hypothetical protein